MWLFNLVTLNGCYRRVRARKFVNISKSVISYLIVSSLVWFPSIRQILPGPAFWSYAIVASVLVHRYLKNAKSKANSSGKTIGAHWDAAVLACIGISLGLMMGLFMLSIAASPLAMSFVLFMSVYVFGYIRTSGDRFAGFLIFASLLTTIGVIGAAGVSRKMFLDTR